jgi:hypothetical protein
MFKVVVSKRSTNHRRLSRGRFAISFKRMLSALYLLKGFSERWRVYITIFQSSKYELISLNLLAIFFYDTLKDSRDLGLWPVSPFSSFPRHLATMFRYTSNKHLLGNRLQVIGVEPYPSYCHLWVAPVNKREGLIKATGPAPLQTSTSSLQDALNLPGFTPCYHAITDLFPKTRTHGAMWLKQWKQKTKALR